MYFYVLTGIFLLSLGAPKDDECCILTYCFFAIAFSSSSVFSFACNDREISFLQKNAFRIPRMLSKSIPPAAFSVTALINFFSIAEHFR